MLEALRSFLAYPFIRLVTPGDPFCIAWLAGAFIFAASWYVLKRRRRARGRLRAFLRAAFPARILRHRSSLLDYQLFLATSFFFASGATGFLISSEMVERGATTALIALFGAAPAGFAPNLALGALSTVLYVLAFELGYWVAHWLMHKLPVMWEFHKVHHSAEVMTPFTEWRQHPVELILFPLCEAGTMGVTYGVLGFLLGPAAQALTLWQVNALLLLFMATTLHLRHSHLWIPARGLLGRIVQSPAHHQIHHSTDPRHFDKNLGLCLSVWDWAFGTLYIPNEREAIDFGIGAEGRRHDSLFSVYWLPIVKAARRLGWPARRATRAPDEAREVSA